PRRRIAQAVGARRGAAVAGATIAGAAVAGAAVRLIHGTLRGGATSGPVGTRGARPGRGRDHRERRWVARRQRGAGAGAQRFRARRALPRSGTVAAPAARCATGALGGASGAGTAGGRGDREFRRG